MVLLWHILILIAVLMGDWVPLLKCPLPTPHKQKQQEEGLVPRWHRGFLPRCRHSARATRLRPSTHTVWLRRINTGSRSGSWRRGTTSSESRWCGRRRASSTWSANSGASPRTTTSLTKYGWARQTWSLLLRLAFANILVWKGERTFLILSTN